MPQITKHPIAALIRDRAMFDETQLQTLIAAYRQMVCNDRWKAAEAIEKAMYEHRRDELERFAAKLEQHEAERIAASPSEGERQ